MSSKSKPKKILKIIGGVIIFFTLPTLLLFAFMYFKYNEELPTGEQGQAADQLATRMLNSLNHDAYKATDYIEFTFKKRHHFKWNKAENTCEVYWKNVKVDLDLGNLDNSLVYISEEKHTGDEKDDYIQKAVDLFNNDTFWLVAPYKAFDSGVERRLVKTEDNKEALLVTYTNGGSTPGDSYLWHFDENGKPKSYQMWVDILPIDGLEASWNDWVTTDTGAELPTFHKLLAFGLEIEGVKASRDTSNLKNNDITHLDVTFIQSGTSIPISMGCPLINGYNIEENNFRYIDSNGFFHKRIKEITFLNEFQNELDKLSVYEKVIDSNINGRITTLINYKSNKVDTLCMGENFQIKLNGIRMDQSDELFNLLKREIKYDLSFMSLEQILDKKNIWSE